MTVTRVGQYGEDRLRNDVYVMQVLVPQNRTVTIHTESVLSVSERNNLNISTLKE